MHVRFIAYPKCLPDFQSCHFYLFTQVDMFFAHSRTYTRNLLLWLKCLSTSAFRVEITSNVVGALQFILTLYVHSIRHRRKAYLADYIEAHNNNECAWVKERWISPGRPHGTKFFFWPKFCLGKPYDSSSAAKSMKIKSAKCIEIRCIRKNCKILVPEFQKFEGPSA